MPEKGIHLLRKLLSTMCTPFQLFPPHAYMHFYCKCSFNLRLTPEFTIEMHTVLKKRNFPPRNRQNNFFLSMWTKSILHHCCITNIGGEILALFRGGKFIFLSTVCAWGANNCNGVHIVGREFLYMCTPFSGEGQLVGNILVHYTKPLSCHIKGPIPQQNRESYMLHYLKCGSWFRHLHNILYFCV